MILTLRSSFVEESLTGGAHDFTTSASAVLLPTLPKKREKKFLHWMCKCRNK